MQKKAVFFDIDGTLWDEHFVIPQSTRRAIEKVRENGHYAFICSGRSRAFIQDENLLSLGFDGIVAGCGTMIEYRDDVLFYKKLKTQTAKEITYLLKEHRIPYIMEGRYHLYADLQAFPDDSFAERLRQSLGDEIYDVTEHLDDIEVSKFSISIPDDNYLKVMPKLEKEFVGMQHDNRCIEFVPIGFSKATGIEKTCELLHIEHENTYAFGDSINDVEMLEYVAHGIVMGNGTPVAKAAADYITDELHEDGIYKGLEHFELI